MSKKCKKQAEAKRDGVINHQKYNLNHWYLYGNTQSFMPSCATVDQESRAHGLILGSGKPGLNQVWAVLNWEGVEFHVPRSAPSFVSLAQTSIWVSTIEKYCDNGH